MCYLLCLHPNFSVMQPHVDFGLKLLGADLMSIPGLYRFVQVRVCCLFFVQPSRHMYESWQAG